MCGERALGNGTILPWHGIDQRHLVSLLPHLPPNLQRVLVVGVGDGEIGLFLRGRAGVEVYGLDTDAGRLERTRACFHGTVHGTPTGELPFPEGYFDAFIITDAYLAEGGVEQAVAALSRFLNAFGQAFLLLPNGRYGRLEADETVRQTLDLDVASIAAASGGMKFYCQWSVVDTALQSAPIDANGQVWCGEKPVPVQDESGRERCATLAWLVQLVQPTYDPLAHARALFDAGRPEWSYNLLINIPDTLLGDGVSRITIHLETMLAILAWRQREGRSGLIEAFSRLQLYFHDIVAAQPDCVPAYQCLAHFWRLLGSVDMSRRTLRSIRHVVADPSLDAQIESMSALNDPGVPDVTVPLWDPAVYRPRILFVMHPRLHFGLDVLYDGLCSALGDDYVTDYPFKSTLHGDTPREMAHYPCSFDRPGSPKSLEQVIGELRDDAYDLVLYGDCEGAIDPDTARQLSDAAGDTPVCIVDAIDESQSSRAAVCAQLGREDVTAYFKREMLACADYGPNAFPLPFAFAEGRSDREYSDYRPTRFFWAGHRQFAMRRLYLEALERHLNVSLEGFYAPDDYNRILRESLIGLNCFGFGFDTVRYWELPARGCMLFSERLPLLIPHNFQDGESAVFWDDVPQLIAKLDYYLADPAEAARVGRAGYAHFWKYHTGTARARQLLGWVQALTCTTDGARQRTSGDA